jgi:CheY-like chemotaxis protein
MSVLNLEGKKILIVEDDEMSYLLLNQIFKLTSCEVMRAKSGKEALVLYKENTDIDLVLMDIKLPDIDGRSVTSEIKKHNSSIPVIAQTAGRTPHEMAEAIAAGCDDVLTKPFRMEELMEVLKKYF